MFGNIEKGNLLGRNKTPTKAPGKPLIGSAPNPNLKVSSKIDTGSRGKMGDIFTHSGKRSVSPAPSAGKSGNKNDSIRKSEAGIGFKVPDYVEFCSFRLNPRKRRALLRVEIES